MDLGGLVSTSVLKALSQVPKEDRAKGTKACTAPVPKERSVWSGQ